MDNDNLLIGKGVPMHRFREEREREKGDDKNHTRVRIAIRNVIGAAFTKHRLKTYKR